MNTSGLSRLGVWDDTNSRRLRIAERPGALRTLVAILAHSGDSWLWIAGLAFVWLWGDDAWKARSEILALGIVFTAVLVMILKFTIRRRRPEGEWGRVYRATDPHSFPSGHAARSALIAVLACSFGIPWFGIILVIWAPLVALARVAMGLHYLSDVIVGTLIGVLIGAGVILLI
ncbi:MAG: phosphatase PAP2 family protein [Anaerolineales bacterium]|nr:phosphatase PAP2 family protein [Anaerolineales bacterium]